MVTTTMTPRIDAHQHYWKLSRGDYDWMQAPDLQPLRRDFLPEHLLPELNSQRIDKTVLVQAAPTVQESDFLLELAERESSVLGVVGWIDCEAPDFERQLSQRNRRPAWLGIRPMLQDISDDHYLLRPTVLESLNVLGSSGGRLDLLVTSRHLATVDQALCLVPGLPAVVDHCAKPDLRKKDLSDWCLGLERVAAHPQVYCKLSGLVTEAPPGFSAVELAPAVEFVWSLFGPDRLMFGSDWPVCTLAASYDRVATLLYEILGSRLSGAAEANLFGRNALRFYGRD